MQTRKQLFAEKRKREAKERKAFNRDQFIRKLLKRNGLQVLFDSPDAECFRGHQVWVDKIIKANDCAIGVVLGCTFCKNSGVALEQIQRGEITNLAFRCRMWPSKPKFWIMQPNEKVLIPGLHLVKRTKPVYDSHGHVIELAHAGPPAGVPTFQGPPMPLPHIIPSPANTTQIVANEFLVTMSINPDWLEDPQAYIVDILAQALTLWPPDSAIALKLIQAFSHERLRVEMINGYIKFSIEEGALPW